MGSRGNKLTPISLRFLPQQDSITACGATGFQSQDRLQDETLIRLANAPWQIYQAYQVDRHESDLARVFANALRIQSIADAVVVVSDTRQRLGDEMFLSACVQPYWNELTRAERGCRPRVYHVDHVADNDQIQSLLYRLYRDSKSTDPAIRDWCLVIHHDAAGSDATRHDPETDRLDIPGSPASRMLLTKLAQHCKLVGQPLADFLVEFGDQPHSEDAAVFSCYFESGQHTRTIFDAAGLFTSALVGINVIELLGGAHSVTESFDRDYCEPELQDLSANAPVFQLAQWIRNLNETHNCECRIELKTFNAAARSLSDWVSYISTNANVLQRQILMAIETEQSRWDTLQWIDEGKPTLCFDSIYASAVKRWQTARSAAGDSAAIMHLRKLDELHVGQVVQCFMLALHLSRNA